MPHVDFLSSAFSFEGRNPEIGDSWSWVTFMADLSGSAQFPADEALSLLGSCSWPGFSDVLVKI